jgi:hypothetical protein
MKAFARLYADLDASGSTSHKVGSMVRYLREAPPATAATLSERTAHSNRLAGLIESVQLLLDELDGIE